QVREVLEVDVIEPRQFAAEHQVKQLPGRPFVRHVRSINAPPAWCTKRSAAARSQSWLDPPEKASRTAAFKTPARLARSSASLARNGQALNPHRRRVGAIAE